MAIQGGQQIAQHGAETAAVRGRNNAALKNHWRQNKEYEVTANLDNVQYLNQVLEQDGDQDRVYQAMMDQWSDTDFHLKKLFAEQDFAIEDAIIEMHENDYAGEQTGASAARRASKSALDMGRKKARALHNKMFARKEAYREKQSTRRSAQVDSDKLFNDVRFAPVHGFRPAKPEMEAGPSKAGLILGLAGTGMKGVKQYKTNTAPGVKSWRDKDWGTWG